MTSTERRRRSSPNSSRSPEEPSVQPRNPTLTLQGDFPGEATVVPRALCTLLTGMGRIEEDGRHVLVPFVEMRLSGIRQGALNIDKGENQEFEQLFSRVLPLENLVWLLADLTRDVRRECEQLINLAAGARSFEASRIAQATAYADDLAHEAQGLGSLLSSICSDVASPKREAPEEKSTGRTARTRGRRQTSG